MIKANSLSKERDTAQTKALFNVYTTLLTSTTQGKVHNPTGEGVRAISSQAQLKAAKHKEMATASAAALETKTKEGTAKRNIQRKKTKDSYDSTKKKQGGHGKGQWKDIMMDPSYTEEVPLDEADPIYGTFSLLLR